MGCFWRVGVEERALVDTRGTTAAFCTGFVVAVVVFVVVVVVVEESARRRAGVCAREDIGRVGMGVAVLRRANALKPDGIALDAMVGWSVDGGSWGGGFECCGSQRKRKVMNWDSVNFSGVLPMTFCCRAVLGYSGYIAAGISGEERTYIRYSGAGSCPIVEAFLLMHQSMMWWG